MYHKSLSTGEGHLLASKPPSAWLNCDNASHCLSACTPLLNGMCIHCVAVFHLLLRDDMGGTVLLT